MHNNPNQHCDSKPSELFSEYSPPENCYCETFESPGQIRSHWSKFVEEFDKIDASEIKTRTLQVERMLQEHGATYNLFSNSESVDQQWKLDLIPMLIPFQEWSYLEKGLIQRTRLLNAILKDVYGEQKLLKEGKLPPELLFCNPGFIRPCTGIEIPKDNFLIFSAVDLCRTSYGQWCLISSRTQTPNCSGFSLENRIIISQLMSKIFQQNRVLRVAPFFMNLQAYLSEIAFYNRDNPTIVFFTPGPSSKTYFEHALLSRYMGYPMVESGDLTVRDNKVYLKTLDGLEPVDVIFRWVKDWECDPLALRNNSNNGVSGLIHAARTQNVVVANPIGTSLVESLAFSEFMPDLCKHILGEDILIHDVSFLWCGKPESLTQVINNPDQYIIKSAFNIKGAETIDLETVSSVEREIFIEKIKATPYKYVAQEKIFLSAIPTLHENRLKPANHICRFFISAAQNDFQVMPGGLMRVNSTQSSFLNTRNEMSRSKDIWVFSEGPVEKISLMSRLAKALEIRRSGKLSSRVADNLLWLGRYLERAENKVRILRSILKKLSGEIPFQDIQELPVLLDMAVGMELLLHENILDQEDLKLSGIHEELLNSIFDRSRPTSLISTLENVNQAAKNVRDRLSVDSWRILMRLDYGLKKSNADQWIQISDSYYLMNEVLMILSSFSGLAMEGMTRGLGWRFMDMGRRIERTNYMVSIIQSAVNNIQDNTNTSLDVLLEVADSSMTYRSRYRTYLQMAPVIDLLISDEINPKSVVFQLSALSKHLKRLPRNGIRKYGTMEERSLLSMLTTVRLADIDLICEANANGNFEGLTEVLNSVEEGIREFSKHITQHYLSRIPTTQHFISIQPEAKK